MNKNFTFVILICSILILSGLIYLIIIDTNIKEASIFYGLIGLSAISIIVSIYKLMKKNKKIVCDAEPQLMSDIVTRAQKKANEQKINEIYKRNKY